MTATAVVGLGPLGLAVARHVSAVLGEPVLGFDIDDGRRRAWATIGSARTSTSISDAGECRQVFIAVAEEDTAIELASRLSAHPSSPAVYVLSTLSARTAALFDRPAGPMGPNCWPVQVTGGEVGALYGRLVAIVPDGLPEAAERFLLETIAKRVLRAGNATDAALIKLLGNAMIAYEFAALTAILDSAAELGVDLRVLSEVLRSGSGGSPALRAMHEYPVEGLRKDLHLLGEAVLAPADPLTAPEGLRRTRSLLSDSQR